MNDLKFCFKILSYSKRQRSTLVVLPIIYFALGALLTVMYVFANDADDADLVFLGPLYISMCPMLMEAAFTNIDQIPFFKSSPIRYDFMIRLRNKFYGVFSAIAYTVTLVVIIICSAAKPNLADNFWLILAEIYLFLLVVTPLNVAFRSSYKATFIIVFMIAMVFMIPAMLFQAEITAFIGPINKYICIVVSIALFILQLFVRSFAAKKGYKQEYSDFYQKMVFEK